MWFFLWSFYRLGYFAWVCNANVVYLTSGHAMWIRFTGVFGVIGEQRPTQYNGIRVRFVTGLFVGLWVYTLRYAIL